MKRTPYFDCNATTPMEPAVIKLMLKYSEDEYGNAGSRTHEMGTTAKRAVQDARRSIAELCKCRPEEVVFTSGATESNNLAILGLQAFGEETSRKHIITTSLEHKAVLEPVEHLAGLGWDVTYVAPAKGGRIAAQDVLDAVRDDTLLISVMHVNNETGIIQPVQDIANGLEGSNVYFHVDAAQGFGKLLEDLQHPRIDMLSISAHKIYGPKGVGALIARRRKFKRPPLKPLLFGGGQEAGLRPGTLPVPLVAGLGEAARLALKNHMKRLARCMEIRENVICLAEKLQACFNGDQEHCIPHVLNFSIPGVNSEAAMVALKGVLAISNGSACTSSSYEPSHVLKAMQLPNDRIEGALRFSWCHLTEEPDWDEVYDRLRPLLR